MDPEVANRLLGILFPTFDLLFTWMIVGGTVIIVSLNQASWRTVSEKISLISAWLRLVLIWPIALGYVGPLIGGALIMQFLFRIGAIG